MQVDPTQTAFRKQRELHWMLTLRTVFPYGLNNRIGDEFKTQEAYLLCFEISSSQKIMSTHSLWYCLYREKCFDSKTILE